MSGESSGQGTRPTAPAAAVLFVLAGVVLLVVPELIARAATGGTLDVVDVLGDLVFLAIGAAIVWSLTVRIATAFRREAAARLAVERRERTMADAIDAVPAAVLLLADSDEPMVAHANPAAARLLDIGFAADRPTRLQAILPIDMETVDTLTGVLVSRSPWSGERTITTDAGRRLPLSIAVTPVATGSGVRAVLVAQDRTELRFAERESERLAVELEGFVQTAPVGFVTVGPDGLVAGWNAAAERILGWTAAEMLGRRLPDELGSVIAESLAAGAGLSHGPRPNGAPPESSEVRLVRPSGEPIVVRLTATTAYGRGHDFFGFTAMFEDVTEARRIAAERDAAEARLRAAVDASPVPLVLLDLEGKVRLWSAAAERLFGWTADQAIGRLFPPVPDDSLEAFFGRLRRVLAGEAVAVERLPYVGRDGKVIMARFWTAAVRGADGSAVGVMGACREEPDAESPAESPEASPSTSGGFPA